MKRIFIGIVSILLLLTMLTGCSAITNTFGKEYRLVDDFFDQFKADIRFSINDYYSSQKNYSEQKDEIDKKLDLLEANLEIARNEMKSNIKNFKDYANEIGYTGSVSDYVKAALLKARIDAEKEFKDESHGKITIKHTEVKRDFFGSIWHFIRNHWLITLIIIGVIGAIIEKLDELELGKSKNSKEV